MLLAPVIEKLGLSIEEDTKEEMKYKINPSDFPYAWTKNSDAKSDQHADDWWNTDP